MWNELVYDEVWHTEHFIDDALVDKALSHIRESETKELDGNEQPHIISKSYYNYNHVKYNVHQDNDIVLAVINKLNEILADVYKPILIEDINEKNVLQFTTKTFNPKSIYNVHTERKDIYGEFVFIHYLTNEEGGELVLPNEYMLADHFNFHPEEKENWEEFKTKLFKESKQDPYLVGPLAIKPKRNSCVLMRVGSAHYVNPVTNAKPNCRVVITGWPFANMDWKAKFNQ
jgi:hypothetical protein|tara:strand:- start:237 stop:926 length:690 start_codon:yes stop_codon:yes gene_type:complete